MDGRVFYWLFVSCDLGTSRSVESCPAKCVVSLTPLKSTPKSSSDRQHVTCRPSRELARCSPRAAHSALARLTRRLTSSSAVTRASRRLRYLHHRNDILSPTDDNANSRLGQLFILHLTHLKNSMGVCWKLVVMLTTTYCHCKAACPVL